MRVGLDIGGTKTDAVVIAGDGTVVQTLRLPTGFGADAVLTTAADAVEQVSSLAGLPIAAITTIGIGIPGAVDPASGRVTHAVNLGLEDLELGSQLHAKFGREVRVENDVNAAALGAFHLLGYASDESMSYLNLGTGLAAGMVLDGKLWRGHHGVSGEIGHLPVDPAGPLCPCGQYGCLEMYASGSAVAREWPTTAELPVRALFDAAAAGDPAATAVRDRLLLGVAEAVRILVLAVDVDHLVIGGGISRIGDELLDGVTQAILRWEKSSTFIASLDLASRVRLLPADFPAAAVGAALVGGPVSSAELVR